MDGLPNASTTELDRSTTRRNLRMSMGDAGCFGGMVGCGETYLPAFALAVGLGEAAAGLVASVPILVGGLMQLISPWAIGVVGSAKRWILAGATIQALSFLPLILVAGHGAVSLPMLLLIASVYWGAGLSTGPAWNTWMEEIVPRQIRASYFSRRARMQKITTFAGLLAAGLLLQIADDHEWTMAGFAYLFAFALVLRLLSVAFLHGHQTDTLRPVTSPIVSERSHAHSANRLLCYLVLVQGFVNIAGPFFAPYMLKQLEFSYLQFVSLLSVAFVTKVIALSYWGLVVKRFGASTLLWIGGIGLVPLSSLWIVTSDIRWLALVQVISGIAWAAYELGFFLMFFESLPRDERTRLLTYYNFANSAAIFLGATLGAGLLEYLDCTQQAYFLLFAMSSIGRLLCLLILTGLPWQSTAFASLRIRIVGVRVSAGSVDSPVVVSIDPDE